MTRKRKLLLGALAAALVLVLVGALALPTLVDVNSHRPRLEEMARDRLGRDVALGELSLSLLPLPAVTVSHLRVAGADAGEPTLETGEVRVGARLLPLFSGRLEITSVSVDQPVVRVRRDEEGRWELLDALLPGDAPREAEPTVSVASVRVTGGRVVVRDAAVRPGHVVVHEVNDLDARVSGLGTPGGSLRLQAAADAPTMGPARLRVDVRVAGGGDLSGEAHVEGLDLATVSPYLEPYTGMADLRGNLTSRLEGRRDPNGSAELDAAVSVADLALPLATPDARPVSAAVELAARVDRDGAVEVQRLRFETGRSRLDAAGSVGSTESGQSVEVVIGEGRLLPSDAAELARAVGLDLPGDVLEDHAVEVRGTVRLLRREAPDTRENRLAAVDLEGLRVSGARVRWRAGLARAERRARPTPELPGVVVRATDVRLDDITLRLIDASFEDEPVETVLEDLRVAVDALAPGRAGVMSLSADVGGGELSLEGELGPWEGDAPVPLDLELVLEGVAVTALSAYLERHAGLAPKGGRLDLRTRLRGRGRESLELEGRLSLVDTRVEAAGRATTLDLTVDHDVAVERGGERIRLRRLALELPGGPLVVDGLIERPEGAPARFDVGTAEPAALTTADIRHLLSLTGQTVPFELEAERPIRLEGRIRRREGDLSVVGKASLERVAVRHAVLEQPLRVGRADVTLEGDTVRLTETRLRIGGSDLGGTLTVRGFDSPRATFDLRSENADLDEIFAFARRAQQGGAGEGGTGGGRVVARLVAEGDLAVARATVAGLELSDFHARARLADGVLTLEPTRFRGYEGRADGRVRLDLSADPPTFASRASLADVAVGPLLAAGLGYEGLQGRGEASLQVAGTVGNAERSVRSATGSGTVALRNGEVGALNVMDVLRHAAVFGETTIAELGARLAEEGTRFERLDARWTLGEGVLRLEELETRTPEADITASGPVDLARQTLHLDGQVAFTRELSQQMREEGSRAAELCWDSRRERVLVPLRLVGTLAEPRADIDWEELAARAGRRRLEEEARGRLGGTLGGLLGGGRDRPEEPPDEARPAAPVEAPSTGGGLTARIDDASFKRKLLAPDLVVSVTLSGPGLSHAILVVRDRDGSELVRVTEPFRQAVAAATGGTVSASARIAGRDLRGQTRVTVEVTPVDAAGGTGPTVTRSVRASLF